MSVAAGGEESDRLSGRGWSVWLTQANRAVWFRLWLRAKKIPDLSVESHSGLALIALGQQESGP